MNKKSYVKIFFDFAPYAIFLSLYSMYNMVVATKAIMIAASISFVANYMIEKKITHLSLFVFLIVIICGGLTIFTGDSKYIKMKPTILYCLFFVILSVAAFLKKGLLKYICGSAINMDDKSWITFSVRFGYYFLFVAVLNEIIWRNFSETTWVFFKVFGIIPLTLIFLFSQFPFILRNKID